MNFKFNNVYLNDVALLVGPKEGNTKFAKYFDLIYKDFYMNTKSFDDALSKMIYDSIDILLTKSKLKPKDIDIVLSSDLSNQVAASSYAVKNISIPYIGVYAACASSTLELILASSLIQSRKIKNAICTVASHSKQSEKQFRYPVEYGAPKRKTTTVTATASASILISNTKSNIKITSATIGEVKNSYIKDVYNMGGVMAISAFSTIEKHLKYTKTKLTDYDLILTGDLGRYGVNILKELLKKDINIMDAGSILDKNFAGASGPVCLPLIAFGPVLEKMKSKEYKKVLLVATGSLHNTTYCNEKKEIPSISHVISLEAV